MRSAVVTSLFCGTLANAIAHPLANPFADVLDAPKLVARADASLTVVENALWQIGNSTEALKNDIASFTLNGLFALQASSATAVQTIYAANTNVSKIDPLTTQDALALAAIIQNLAKVVSSTINVTIDKKPDFGGVSPIVLYTLQQQQNATLKFTETTNVKLPTNLRSLSAQLTAPIFASLAQGIKVYMEPNVNPKNSSVYSNVAAPTGAANYAAIAAAALTAVGLALIQS